MAEQIKSDYNGIVMAKPAHLTDKEWSETQHSLKQSQGGRLFSSHVHKEPAKGSMAVPDSPNMQFEADRIKAERKAAREAAAKAEKEAGSLVE
jgi:hypothetical protein